MHANKEKEFARDNIYIMWSYVIICWKVLYKCQQMEHIPSVVEL